MDAVSGTLMLALSASLFGWAYVEYRRPDPSRWTKRSLPADILNVSCIALMAFGLGHLGRALAGSANQGFGPFELSAVVAIAVAAVGIQFLLRRRFAALWAAAGGSATVTTLELPEEPMPPLSRGSGRSRKAA